MYVYNNHYGEYIVDLTGVNRQIIDKFLDFLKKRSLQCYRAYILYTVLFNLIVIPIALLSLTVSVAAFIMSSRIASDDVNRYVSLSIGIAGIVIASGHSALNYLEFDAKRKNFLLQKQLYIRLYEKTVFSNLISLEKTVLHKYLDSKLNKIHRLAKYDVPCILQSKNETIFSY